LLCKRIKAKALHERREERFAESAVWIVKIPPGCRRRFGDDYEPDAFRLVLASEKKVRVSPH
jgi:hypothetical protein